MTPTRRTGDDYRASLSDGRAVHLDGKPIDVATHRAFAGIIDTMADLVELGGRPEHSTHDEAVGTDVAWWWKTPRTIDDLARRREASVALAEATSGFVGRGPDHVASFFAGFVGGSEVFGERREAVTDFWRQAAAADQYVSYVIIPPSIDRARAAEGGERTQVRIADQGAEGITIDGTHILGTGTAISDWLFVSCIPPVKPTDDDLGLSFVVPVATEGLRIHCRKPFSINSSVFDAPFSSRFDETDAVVVFDSVHVPWEHVFVANDPAATGAQFHGTAAHALGNLQAQIRLNVKLTFLLGLAMRIAEISGGAQSAANLDRIAELAALAASVEAHVLAAEYRAEPDHNGVMTPAKRYLYTSMSRQAEVYPRALHLLREMTSSQAIDLPSSVDGLEHPDLIDHASSPNTDADERIKLYRLAWDVVGSEFASRHHQYEMFYAGAPEVSRAHTRRTWGLADATDLLDRALTGWDRDTPQPWNPIR